ncbi:MAG: hypothetical protein HLUCCX14_07335 [Marinobacter excellens HL-55]|uniref:Uncharacterized protein n=1 Tax=Marinobacter excellens HL-55 TaxID=1305731 RepID=A0A0P7Z409_9GAMM|nr:MAG: hypothetical protein HLUCCX14_07335 [Marinobacter excellens HL-55]
MAKLFSRRSKDTSKDPIAPPAHTRGDVSSTAEVAEFPERSKFVRSHSSRLVSTSVGWFALTRDEGDLGPFATEILAETALHEYLQSVPPRDIREFAPKLDNGVLIHDTETCKKRHCAFCIEAGVLAEDNWSELIDQIDFVLGD